MATVEERGRNIKYHCWRNTVKKKTKKELIRHAQDKIRQWKYNLKKLKKEKK